MRRVFVAAAARVEPRRSSTACTDLIKRYQKTASSPSSIGVTRPASIQAAFKAAAKEARSLASSGPSALRSAFRHLANADDQLAKTDFSNPASLSELGGSAPRTPPTWGGSPRTSPSSATSLSRRPRPPCQGSRRNPARPPGRTAARHLAGGDAP